MPQAHHPTPPPQHPAMQRPLWHVTGQSFARRYVVGQDPVDEWTVYFETRNFVSGQVTLLAADYTPDAVAAAIEPVATNLEHIHALEGPR